MGKGGDVFVLDMGEPVKITNLAKKMLRLSGLTEKTIENPNGDIEIELLDLGLVRSFMRSYLLGTM